MAGQRSLLNAAMSRVAVGLLAAAATVLLAPTAVATPETDADDAISGAWNASGGPAGPLGPPDGGVYPVGGGYGQNYAGGKIFFTPATGAHVMQGAILEKYESLGGPADSDLGFPTIDEGVGRAPNSRNTTFSASDKPVIFWTPDTGARVVRGAINAAWDKLGGSAGSLGVPVEDEVYRGDVVTQKFSNGELSWNRKSKTFTTVPPELAGQLTGLAVPDDATSAINAARRVAGGSLGPLGAKEGDQYPIGSDGVGQNFVGGKIFYSPATGANVVTGQVLQKYESVGGPLGDLGFPTSVEFDGGRGADSKMTTFAGREDPVIFWTSDYGAVIVRGAMNAAWAKLGGATGPLGAPMADQTENGKVISQRFSGGVLSWDKANGKFTTEPSNLAAQLAGLKVPGQDVPKATTSAAPSSVSANHNRGFTWRWLWLLALIPIVLLAGVLTGVGVRARRRRQHESAEDYGVDSADAMAYDQAPVGTRQRPVDDEYAAEFGDHYGSAGFSVAHDKPADQWGFRTPVTETAEGLQDGPAADDEDDQPRADQEIAAGQENPDDVDTSPTFVSVVPESESPVDQPEVGPAAHFQPDPMTDTGRHARIEIDEPTPGQTAIHLPFDDPRQVPRGYPIKADTRSGLYWSPTSGRYDEAVAEIWFINEEFARTNGFVRAD
jgi:uncharacterized protein with LGFP repeats